MLVIMYIMKNEYLLKSYLFNYVPHNMNLHCYQQSNHENYFVQSSTRQTLRIWSNIYLKKRKLVCS